MCTELPGCTCIYCKRSDRNDPPPAVIAEKCRAIHAGWTRRERLTRIADDATQRVLTSRQPVATVDDKLVTDPRGTPEAT